MQEKIREVLSGVIDPNTGKDLVSSKALKKVTTEDGKTTVQIELDYPAKTQGPVIEEMVRAKLVEAGIPADVKISQNIIAHEVQRGVKVFDSVRNIIAVSSGKGGVGKSTVTWRSRFSRKAPKSVCWMPTFTARASRQCSALPINLIPLTARLWSR